MANEKQKELAARVHAAHLLSDIPPWIHKLLDDLSQELSEVQQALDYELDDTAWHI